MLSGRRPGFSGVRRRRQGWSGSVTGLEQGQRGARTRLEQGLGKTGAGSGAGTKSGWEVRGARGYITLRSRRSVPSQVVAQTELQLWWGWGNS